MRELSVWRTLQDSLLLCLCRFHHHRKRRDAGSRNQHHRSGVRDDGHPDDVRRRLTRVAREAGNGRLL